MEEFATDKREGRIQNGGHERTEVFLTGTIVKIKNLDGNYEYSNVADGIEVKVYHDDGSETHYFYNTKGELTGTYEISGNRNNDGSDNEGGLSFALPQSGGGVKGLTILNYNAVQPGDYGELYGGVVLDLKYNGPGVNGKWVQIINTNRPASGKTSPYFDSNDGTIYYPAQEYDKETNTKSFYDRPERLPEDDNVSWRGQLILYSNQKAVFSISYGFDLNNGISTPKPLTIKKW